MSEQVVTPMVPVAPPRGAPPKDPTKLADYLARKAAAQAYAGTGAALSGPVYSPVHHVPETAEQIIARVTDRFDIMYKVVHGCSIGAVRSLIISGAGGIGKTFGVEEVVERERSRRESEIELMEGAGIPELIVEKIGGYMTPMSLYMALYRNRFENSLLIFDDCDSVLEDGKSINLLKHATDTTPVRTLSYASAAQELKDAGIPQTHQFQGTIIVISNLDFHGIVARGRHKLVPHLQALMTRTDVLDLKLHTSREKVIWINHVVESSSMLIKDGLSGEQQNLVMKYLVDNQENFNALSFRTVRRIAGYMKSDFADWKRLANVLMLK